MFDERDLVRLATAFVEIGVIDTVVRGRRVCRAATARRGQSVVVECRSEFANALENEKQLEMLDSLAYSHRQHNLFVTHASNPLTCIGLSSAQRRAKSISSQTHQRID